MKVPPTPPTWHSGTIISIHRQKEIGNSLLQALTLLSSPAMQIFNTTMMMILPLIGRMGLSWRLRVWWWWWWSWQPEHPWPSKPLWLVPLLSQKPPEEIFLQDLFGDAFSIIAVLHSPLAYKFSCLSVLLQKGTWGKVHLSLSNFYYVAKEWNCQYLTKRLFRL